MGPGPEHRSADRLEGCSRPGAGGGPAPVLGGRLALRVPRAHPRPALPGGHRGCPQQPNPSDQETLMRVLLIEDEPAIARDVAGALAEAGYVVDIARDGEEGWFRASTEGYDVIILDLGLPKLDGLSVVRRLREDDSTVPILVL